MVLAIRITDDLARLDKVLHRHERELMTKAVPQAINKTVTTVASRAVKHVSAITSEKQKDIRAKMVLKKASPKHLSASVDMREARATNLIKFVSTSQRNAGTFRRRTKKGFKHPGVKAKAWGSSKYYRGTFIGTGKDSGAQLVFKRGSSGKAQSVTGPSARREFIKPDSTAMLRRVTKQRIRIELSAAINNMIRRQV